MKQDELKKHLLYNPLTGIFTRKVSSGGILAGEIAGGLDPQGYHVITVNGKKYGAHRLAWLYMHSYFPPEHTDHINGVRNDNRICNLRVASHAENLQNQIKPRADNTSGFLGVSLHKPSARWRATIRINGKTTHLGYYPTPELASGSYLASKRQHHSFCTI